MQRENRAPQVTPTASPSYFPRRRSSANKKGKEKKKEMISHTDGGELRVDFPMHFHFIMESKKKKQKTKKTPCSPFLFLRIF